MLKMQEKVLQEHLAVVQATHKLMTEQTAQIERILQGPDGILVEVDRLKQIQTRTSKFLWLVLGTSLSILGRLVFFNR